MTLHEAIEKLLGEKGRAMTTSEIAAELNRNHYYTKKDGSLIIPYQIHGRTSNYPQLFKKQGSLVSLVNKPIAKSVEKSPSFKAISETHTEIKLSKISFEKELMNESLFRKASDIDAVVPTIPGLYCVRISYPGNLPKKFSSELLQRGHNIIYIGKASQSLHRRFLGQELRARGHGTFFRSIGTVLGYKPPKGSLINNKNKRNFKYSPQDETKIITWINVNLLVNWVELYDNLSKVESELVLKYKPLLNIDGNPLAMDELRRLRAECVRVANKVS